MLENAVVGNEVEAPSETQVWDLVGQTAHRRAATYGLLSRLYRVEVDKEFLQELKETRFPAKAGNALMDEGYRAMTGTTTRTMSPSNLSSCSSFATSLPTPSKSEISITPSLYSLRKKAF